MWTTGKLNLVHARQPLSQVWSSLLRNISLYSRLGLIDQSVIDISIFIHREIPINLIHKGYDDKDDLRFFAPLYVFRCSLYDGKVKQIYWRGIVRWEWPLWELACHLSVALSWMLSQVSSKIHNMYFWYHLYIITVMMVKTSYSLHFCRYLDDLYMTTKLPKTSLSEREF